MILEQNNLLFKETLRLTEIKDFGYPWEKLMEGKDAIPPQGLKFDIYFEGEIYGEYINGKIEGVDYLTVRPDGKFILDLHAVIKTKDGGLIQLTESGVNQEGKLQLNMDFHTSDERYIWLNKLHVWGAGDVNLQSGKATVQGYSNAKMLSYGQN